MGRLPGRGGHATATLEGPPHLPPPGAGSGPTRFAGGIVLRAPTDFDARVGERVPLLLDLDQLYVFDREGHRVCPAPARVPTLER